MGDEPNRPPVLGTVIGPRERAAGVVYVHDLELDHDLELTVGEPVVVRDGSERYAATVTARVGPRWRLRLHASDPQDDAHTPWRLLRDAHLPTPTAQRARRNALEELRNRVDTDPESRARAEALKEQLRRELEEPGDEQDER